MNFKKVIYLAIVSIGFGFDSIAQETVPARKVGLSALLQGSQYGIALPIWAGKQYVVEPQISIRSAQSIGSEFGLALAQRFYFNRKTLAPYAGLNLGTIMTIASDNATPKRENQIDFVGGLAFGAEYFLAPQFSVRVEAQANFSQSDDQSNQFGNPGKMNFNTGTLISASVYF